MASVESRRKVKASSLAEVRHASTLISHAWRVVHGGLVVSSSKPSEGLPIWFSKSGKDGLLVWDSKPGRDGLMVWALKPSVAGLTGLDLKT
jgi:hypothetical protein